MGLKAINKLVDTFVLEIVIALFGLLLCTLEVLENEAMSMTTLWFASPFLGFIAYLLMLKIIRRVFPGIYPDMQMFSVIVFFLSLSVLSIWIMFLDWTSVIYAWFFLFTLWVPTCLYIFSAYLRFADSDISQGMSKSELHAIAISDERERRRAAALELITDIKVLEEVAANDDAEEVRFLAKCKIAKQHMAAINDQVQLLKLAREAEEDYMRCAAIAYIGEIEALKVVYDSAQTDREREAANERVLELLDEHSVE